MFQSKTGSDATKIEEKFELAMVFERNFFSWIGIQCIFRRFPRLIFSVLSIDELWMGSRKEDQL
jgi:hypothetical protein